MPNCSKLAESAKVTGAVTQFLQESLDGKTITRLLDGRTINHREEEIEEETQAKAETPGIMSPTKRLLRGYLKPNLLL